MTNKLQARLDSLTAREKIIVFTTLVVVLWGGWDNLVLRPLTERQKQLDGQRLNLETQIGQLAKGISELEKTGQTDPNADNLAKLAALKAQYSRMQKQFLLGSKKFVPPELMAKALGDILNQNGSLSLMKLETLPPTTLLEAKSQIQPIYKHGMVITFSGTFVDTVNYLEALEGLPWAIVWDVLDYEVKAYPKAEITLHVLTLSFDKEWMGV